MVRPLVLPTYLPTYTCLLTNHLTGWQALPFLELGPTIDRELCEVLGRLFVAAEAGSPCITLISVYMTLQKDGSEAWQRVHTNKAAADGQYAPGCRGISAQNSVHMLCRISVQEQEVYPRFGWHKLETGVDCRGYCRTGSHWAIRS